MEPASEPVIPALEGASVAGIVPALVGGRDATWVPDVARQAEAVVLLVLDGLGWNALQEHAHALPTLHGMTGGAITTVVPSTTATALTSICTGLAPAQHGVLGYRIRVGADVLNVLRWSVPDARPPEPLDVQRHTAFLGREVPAVTKSEFRTSGFSKAHLRGAQFVGWSTTAVLVEHCARLVASGERFVYAYYPGVDNVAHEFGLHDGFYERELAFADQLVAELLSVLPARATLLVTADHGQIHLERSDWIELTELLPLVDVMAGDGRFRYLYAKRGAAKELAEAARALAGPHAWVRTRAEVLDGAWIGHGATGSVPGRLGDVVLASRDASAFVDPALSVEVRLRSGHGSLTPDEMYVPLVAAVGRAVSSRARVSRFRPEEWDVLRELRLRSLAEDPDAFGSTHAREVAFDEAIWRERATAMALATYDGTPAGIVGARVAEPRAVELISMWVAPECRGRGVGDALVEWVVDEARRDRSHAVKLWFATGNDAARRLYERAGFVEVEDDTPIAERFDRHDHRMVLPLRNVRVPSSAADEAIIPVLRVSEARRAVAWYARLGFLPQWEHQFEPGFPWFVCVGRGPVRIYLSEHEGDARPDTLVHLNVRNIDEIAAEFGETVDEVGLAGREVELVDPDGNRLRIATPRS